MTTLAHRIQVTFPTNLAGEFQNVFLVLHANKHPERGIHYRAFGLRPESF